jgi:carboxyl-terminal processing protease
MKRNYLIPFLLFFILIVFNGSTSESDAKKDVILMKLVYNSLKANHYAPKDMDDDYSEDVYELYLKRLDYTKRFLLEEDIKKLDEYKFKIDNEIKASTYDFFEQSIDLLEKRIDEAESYYEDALEKPFDFSGNGKYERDGDKKKYAKNKKELKERWIASMKYETLIRLYTAVNKNEDKAEEEKKSFEELEKESREKVLKNTREWFDRLRKQERDDWVSIYINTLANVYDPHTGYFPPKDKEDFDIQMSGRFEGIGARLSQKDDYIEIVDVIPGSASYKQGELEVGDLILEVASDDEVIDVVGMRVDHAVKYIRGPKGTEVQLTVRKKDGVIKTIPIIRDVVELEQTYARSTVLKNDKNEEGVGYIYLPKFYANFNSKDGRTSSGDVAEEIEKLKAENVSGIIVDLRNNGGGSLQDVVKIAGLFIESGPIVQVKDRYRPPYILKDTDPTIAYDGPLVIMTNFFSASASEILAAAMQDYNRGIIIGSESTFGKGTVQSFVNLDQYVQRVLKGNNSEDFPSLGSVKMTFQKFYRIDGRSTQLRGVTPDIILPDSYEEIDLGEKEQDFALEWDEIEETVYTTAYPEAFTDKLTLAQQKSYSRIDTSRIFNLIHENAKRLKEQRESTLVSLNFEE